MKIQFIIKSKTVDNNFYVLVIDNNDIYIESSNNTGIYIDEDELYNILDDRMRLKNNE